MREPLTDLPEQLLRERDTVVRVLGDRWWEALLFASGRWVLDYLTLLAALYAVGAEPRASLVLLAFFAAQLLGTLPLTPGGLGFVEAGLTGTLALAGVPARRGGGCHARLPARLVLAADPRGRDRGDHPQTKVRRHDCGGARGGLRPRGRASTRAFGGPRARLSRRPIWEEFDEVAAFEELVALGHEAYR